MKKSLATRKLITSIMVTVTLLYFMAKSPSPKIIFIPFLICGVSMDGKSIAKILDKKKLEIIFGKIFVFGFIPGPSVSALDNIQPFIEQDVTVRLAQ